MPSLRGPAPIHHALLQGREHIGISLQTLDEQCFDHGTVLAQTPPPGMPIRPGSSLEEVTRDAAAAAAHMLIQGLRDRLHVPPHKEVGWLPAQQRGSRSLSRAPKVTKADSQIDWTSWTGADCFERRLRVFGSVWTQAVDDKGTGRRKRLLWHNAGRVDGAGVRGGEGTVLFVQQPATGRGDGEEKRLARAARMDDETGACHVCVDEDKGAWVRVTRVTVEGRTEQDAAKALRAFFREPTPTRSGSVGRTL